MSIIVPLEGFGGGNNPLNFKVVGNPQPSNPKENTIWVNTDTKITGWEISKVSAPSWDMSEGFVYLASEVSTWDDSAAIDVLKKNDAFIKIIKAKQYVSGEWVDVPAEIYKNGAWVALKLFLIENGSDNTALTGGWSACYWGHTSTHQRTTPVITWASDAVVIDINQSSMSEWYGDYCYHWGYAHNNAIDLTDVKSIEAVVDSSAFGGSYPEDDGGHAWTRLVVGKSRDSSPVASADIASRGTVTNKTVTLDVSNLTGEYYIGFFASFYCANSKALKVTAYNIELKR